MKKIIAIIDINDNDRVESNVYEELLAMIDGSNGCYFKEYYLKEVYIPGDGYKSGDLYTIKL